MRLDTVNFLILDNSINIFYSTDKYRFACKYDLINKKIYGNSDIIHIINYLREYNIEIKNLHEITISE